MRMQTVKQVSFAEPNASLKRKIDPHSSQTLLDYIVVFFTFNFGPRPKEKQKKMCNSSLSDIRSFYGNKTVLLTGVTGFLGKVLLEKLLRSCGDLKTIYVLIRDKGGKSFDLRLEEVFASEVFDGLKEERRDFQEMVKAIRGDCSQDSFGLSDADEETVLEEVDCIFHLANAKINDPRETAAKVNARSVRDLISMTKRCKRLKVSFPLES